MISSSLAMGWSRLHGGVSEGGRESEEKANEREREF
jgi:hypothetical protein